jgi:hypothetical protein
MLVFMYVPVGISATTFNTGLETATKRIPNNGFLTPKQVKKKGGGTLYFL